MKAVLRRKNPGKGGIPRFEHETCSRLEDSGFDSITFQASSGRAYSDILTRRRAAKALENEAEAYKSVFVPAQTYLTFTDLAAIDTEIIPYVHDIFPATTNYSGPVSTWLAMRYIESLHHCDTVLCNSEFVRQELVERSGYQGTAQVVYQGIGIPPAENPTPYSDRQYDLIYVGSLIPRKDPATVRRVARQAEDEGLDMVAVNKEPLDLPCAVRTDVSDEELVDLYDNSRYYLQPSFLEGFGRGPVEAQRRGCVPIARDNAVNREVLGDFVELTDDVLDRTGPEDWQQRQAGAIENSKRFDWDRTVEEIVEVVG